MLRLLRKIRKSLIESGSVRKYLLYAIGEILLVMIGILLALQVNNWNEERKKNLLEVEYLFRLKQELNNNVLNAESGLYFQTIQNHCASRILSFVSKNSTDSNELHLAYSIVLTGWTNKLDYVNNVWKELYSTGNARLITNTDLRKRLIEIERIYEQIDEFNKEFNGFNLGFRRLVGDVLSGNLQVELSQNFFRSGWDEALLEGFKNDELPTVMLNSSIEGSPLLIPSSSTIRSKLSYLKEVEGYLADIIQGRQKLVITFNQLIQEISEIIDIIDIELNNSQ